MTNHPDHAGGVHLAAEDAAELGQLFTFLSDWLDGHDTELLAASFRRFMGTTGYDLAELQADVDRFAFLLGDEGERLFGPDQP